MKKVISRTLTLLILLLCLIAFSGCFENDNLNFSKPKTISSPSINKTPETESQTGEKEPSREEAQVVEVIDGDTIVVLLNGVRERVRLIGIDTPEVGRPYYEEATRKTTELVLGKTVRLEKDISERDKYGRLLRYVYVGSLFVNAELVRQGYAHAYTYPPDVKYADYFTQLQREAREKGVGLWGPSTNSKNNETKQKVKYVASKRRAPFHYPWCPWAKKIAPYNLQTFASREEAIKAGHRPCKVCNP